MKLQLIITLDNGKVSVTGPLDNRLVCYGLLKEAENVIREYKSQLVQPVGAQVIQKPNGG